MSVGEMDAEGEYYVVVCKELELLAFGHSVNQETFLNHATESKRRELETAKHAAHYLNEDFEARFYQDLKTGAYDFISTKHNGHKTTHCGDLEDVISFIGRCISKLDDEKKAYETAIKTLKDSEQK